MTKFDTPKQLKSYLTMVIDDIIRNEVRETIVDIWLKVQAERVYGTYIPKEYVRRREDGGLADPDNIEFADVQSFKNSVNYVLENITIGNGWDDYVGRKINALIEGASGFAGDPATGMPPRPYTEEAIGVINSHPTAMKEALSKGFARHGVRVTIR